MVFDMNTASGYGWCVGSSITRSNSWGFKSGHCMGHEGFHVNNQLAVSL
jgi:gamma-glutamyltranspeptidase